MQLYLYNTLTRQKELFVPLMDDPNYIGPKKDFVGMYSCGPTVYSMPHFGNLRSAFTADMIRNVLKYIVGYKTIVVSNFTDVGHLVSDGDEGEDKMEKGSRLEGLTAWDIAKKYENIFREDFKKLHIDDFDVMPRATEHIQEQIDLVKTLEAKGFTYAIPEDGIYMDTSKVDDYGKLLGANYKKHLEGLNAGERIDIGAKKNATDFAVWKFAPANEKRQMERDSPRGKGFPGWHAECSAMSSKYLGDQFDIHHGGYDLIPVHHTNEIVQSECSSGMKPRVKYRIHHQFVTMNGKKMSKSDGNYTDPSEVVGRGIDFLDLRYRFFSAHYRAFLDFTWDNIQQAKQARHNLIKKIGDDLSTAQLFTKEKSFVAIEKKLKTDEGKKFRTEISEAIGDDINTTKALAIINIYLADAHDEVRSMMYRLETYFLKIGLFQTIKEEKIDIPADIKALANQRLQAKKDKNYVLADEIRNKVQELGFIIKDTKDSYEITKI